MLTGIKQTGALCLSVLSNLWQGVKLNLFLRVERRHFALSALHLFCIAALVLLAYCGMDYRYAEKPAVFSVYALGEKCVWFVVVLLTGLVPSLLARKESVFWSFPVVFLNALFIPIILHCICLSYLSGEDRQDYDSYREFTYIIYFIIAFRSLMVVMPQQAGRQLAGALFAVALNYLTFSTHYFYYSSFWYKEYEEEEQTRETSFMAEDALSDQSVLLDKQLQKIAPRKKGKNYFVVTYGSDDAQDVFMKEALFARGVLGKKLNAAERIVTLINNPAMLKEFPLASVNGIGRMFNYIAHKAAEQDAKKVTEEKPRYPLATTTNLARILQELGKKADAKEDVLVLYITSHGGGGAVSVNLSGISLRQLSAKQLKEMLKASGFQWKVIMISACYSGSFIETLKDDTSIIITSSREDRVSYGCGKDDDLTYFGRALLQHALPKTNSFIEAYELARENVQHQEEDSRIRKHSQPQIYVGRKVREYLK